MKSVLTAGVCVSCGRESGRFYRTCPYCGEQVWQTRGRRLAQALLLVLPPVLLTLLALATRPDLDAIARAARAVHPALGFLFAAGLGLLLLPPPDSDVIITSRADAFRWHTVAILGGWLMGLTAAACALCLNFGRTLGAPAWLLTFGIAAGIVATPFFIRIPWRALTATALLALALASL